MTMYVPDIFAYGARRWPQRDCLVQGDRRLSFAQVHERASLAAAGLARAGVRRGDRVALLARNEIEYLEVLGACMRGGFVVVPLNFRLHPVELAAIVADCEPAALIVGADLEATAEQLEAGLRLTLGPEGSYAAMLGIGASGRDEPAAIRADDLWAIYYTGGTTGRPKGVMLTNGALYARINEFTFALNIRPDARFLQVQPLFHMASQISACFAMAGAANIQLKSFEPASWLDAVQRERATHALLVPTIISMICNSGAHDHYDLGSLQQIHYSASPISPDLLARALEVFPCELVQSYGQTETGLSTLLSFEDHHATPELLDSAGRAVASSTVRIVDDSLVDVPTGSVGEVVHRGPGQMIGYWRAPEQTGATLRDGWVLTGDLGRFSEEGYLYLVDRKKDMIITGGENVYAREVDDVLASHPAVLEVAVIGVPHATWGEAIHAVVVPRSGAGVTEAELAEHCRVRLAGYKVPKTFEFVEHLPKSPVGKILKKEIRARVAPHP